MSDKLRKHLESYPGPGNWTPAELPPKDKVRDALWRYAPDRTERLATVAMLVAAGVFAAANWLRKGRYQ